MLVKIYEENPSEKEVAKIVAALDNDCVIIYPTDSVYAFGCSIRSPRAIERLRRIKGKKETTFSIVFESISQVSEYCRVDNATFHVLKRNLPGPFTFILAAASAMPSKALEGRKTIGVRIPSNATPRAIVAALGCPMVTTSVHDADESEYLTDPDLIEERYRADVDMVIDGGAGDTIPTTVIDLLDGDPVLLREGRGVLV